MKLQLTKDQLRVVIAGLGELPMKIAAPVAMEIDKQLRDAEKAEAAEKAKSAEIAEAAE